MISKKLINQMNEYYGCEYIVTEKPKKQAKVPGPRPGKIYALTGGPGTPCIAAGNSWEESVVKEDEA